MSQNKVPRFKILKLLALFSLCFLLVGCGKAEDSLSASQIATEVANRVQSENEKSTEMSITPTAPQGSTKSKTPITTSALTPVKATPDLKASPTVAQNETQQEGNPSVGVKSTPPTDNKVETYSRILRFSGQEWWVKNSSKAVGPGPNLFSDSADNVWVDGQGRLHLKVTQQGGKWHCAEVVSVEVLGYGSYQFKIASGIANLDKYLILGLFTWDTTSPQNNFREIDIELSSWAEPTTQNAQFVVQPWDHSGNRHRFAVDPRMDSSTQIFNWAPKNVQFMSFLGETQSPTSKNILNQWSYSGDGVPPAGGVTNARINLWLLNGHSPANGEETEIVLSSFEYIPQIQMK